MSNTDWFQEEVGRIREGMYERWGTRKVEQDGMTTFEDIKIDTVEVLCFPRDDQTGRKVVLYRHADGPHEGEFCYCSPSAALLKFRPIPNTPPIPTPDTIDPVALAEEMATDLQQMADDLKEIKTDEEMLEEAGFKRKVDERVWGSDREVWVKEGTHYTKDAALDAMKKFATNHAQSEQPSVVI